jgi:hypothetical protein
VQNSGDDFQVLIVAKSDGIFVAQGAFASGAARRNKYFSGETNVRRSTKPAKMRCRC